VRGSSAVGAGQRLAHDAAVIAFDDTEWAPFLAPPLTTLAHPTCEQQFNTNCSTGSDSFAVAGIPLPAKAGSPLPATLMAAELLERRLADPLRPAVTVLLPPRLVVRGSCGNHSGAGLPYSDH